MQRIVPSWSVIFWMILIGFGSEALFAQANSGSCPDCGSVTGSISVAQATIRTEGQKHDRDVVVYLEPIAASEIPPSSIKTEMDQQGLVFIPHVLAIHKGTTVTFLNNDNEQHNVYFLNDKTGETLDIGTWGQGVSVDHQFNESGLVITLCKLHLEMAAYIVVLESPWYAATLLDSSTKEGNFTIENVPPGQYELTVWHKKLKQKGGAAKVTVSSGGTTEHNVVITKSKYAKSSK